MSRLDDLHRIETALRAAGDAVRLWSNRSPGTRIKPGGDPVTEVDSAINDVLRSLLPDRNDGWLSEETEDSADRLGRSRVWVVDPLDGTREFIEGVPEWCISVGLVEDGRPVAGGILNPIQNQLILGAPGHGLTLNGKAAGVTARTSLSGARVLVSRSEWKRGEWSRVPPGDLQLVPMGSVAYKLAQVASGLADATCTLQPKNEWDVAAGVALILAGGGAAWVPGSGPPTFNRQDPKLPGLVAAPSALEVELAAFISSIQEA
jgi:myo-inositol-1(or 4)-monophosphatase